MRDLADPARSRLSPFAAIKTDASEMRSSVARKKGCPWNIKKRLSRKPLIALTRLHY
jgi:hypothetical protein